MSANCIRGVERGLTGGSGSRSALPVKRRAVKELCSVLIRLVQRPQVAALEALRCRSLYARSISDTGISQGTGQDVLQQRCKRAVTEIRQQLTLCCEAWHDSGVAAAKAMKGDAASSRQLRELLLMQKAMGDHGSNRHLSVNGGVVRLNDKLNGDASCNSGATGHNENPSHTGQANGNGVSSDFRPPTGDQLPQVEIEPLWQQLDAMLGGLSEDNPKWATRLQRLTKSLQERHLACLVERNFLHEASERKNEELKQARQDLLKEIGRSHQEREEKVKGDKVFREHAKIIEKKAQRYREQARKASEELQQLKQVVGCEGPSSTDTTFSRNPDVPQEKAQTPPVPTHEDETRLRSVPGDEGQTRFERERQRVPNVQISLLNRAQDQPTSVSKSGFAQLKLSQLYSDDVDASTRSTQLEVDGRVDTRDHASRREDHLEQRAQDQALEKTQSTAGEASVNEDASSDGAWGKASQMRMKEKDRDVALWPPGTLYTPRVSGAGNRRGLLEHAYPHAKTGSGSLDDARQDRVERTDTKTIADSSENTTRTSGSQRGLGLRATKSTAKSSVLTPRGQVSRIGANFGDTRAPSMSTGDLPSRAGGSAAAGPLGTTGGVTPPPHTVTRQQSIDFNPVTRQQSIGVEVQVTRQQSTSDAVSQVTRQQSTDVSQVIRQISMDLCQTNDGTLRYPSQSNFGLSLGPQRMISAHHPGTQPHRTQQGRRGLMASSSVSPRRGQTSGTPVSTPQWSAARIPLTSQSSTASTATGGLTTSSSHAMANGPSRQSSVERAPSTGPHVRAPSVGPGDAYAYSSIPFMEASKRASGTIGSGLQRTSVSKFSTGLTGHSYSSLTPSPSVGSSLQVGQKAQTYSAMQLWTPRAQRRTADTNTKSTGQVYRDNGRGRSSVSGTAAGRSPSASLSMSPRHASLMGGSHSGTGTAGVGTPSTLIPQLSAWRC